MSDDTERKVIEFIHLHGLLAGARRVLLAVSGGADSTALLYLLASLRVKGSIEAELVCAHVNHQLRGAASDEDERFVVEQAAGLSLPVVTTAVDVRAHARTHRLSLETAARQLRLASLSRLAQEYDCTWVATGHQKNDNAETIIHRLRRGTGMRGLAGIRPVRPFDDNLWLARPLLCLTRDELVRYLESRPIPWREDHTNVDVAHTRNFIRHKLLPFLQHESRGSLVEELSELAESAGRLYELVRRRAEEAWPKLVRPGEMRVALEASGLASLPEPVAVELIRRALAGLGSGERDLTQRHYRAVLQLARQPVTARSVSLPGAFVARYEEGRIILQRGNLAAQGVELAWPATETLQIPGRTWLAGYEIQADVLERREVLSGRIEADKNPFSEYFDLDQVEPLVEVRPRRTGDRFQPLGMSDEKKVGKFLTAEKTPRRRREQILIFADREKIIWVCPVRISERAKVTEKTQHILHLKVIPPQEAGK